MSEKIGNAITDQKNMVELMTADTAIVSGGGSSEVVFSAPISAQNEGFLIYYNGEFYIGYKTISSNFEMAFQKVTLPTT